MGCQGAKTYRLLDLLVMFPASAVGWVICAQEALVGSTMHLN